ncbi:hypothetical protein GSI_12024 [Ganoderma sinense ZZ0214-1]|uniref:BTB domain-containing protein n=1 Tax=Ganoderma sinense ZZ0214-1 TaxID=1077348 RepID=A0A2G8RY72_9APHY|nr:hypothetical protein GSI_12024 [Ganoderma sinense ZZ0214-1]
MSPRITRKRSRTKEDDNDQPPAKREPELDSPQSGVGAGATSTSGSTSGGSAHPHAEQQTGQGQASDRDDEFWFEDGTVILVAWNIEFRFYKGLLASVSPVFKQLFADCRAVRTVRMDQDQTFSCPVVHVPDSPEDLRYLLRTCSSKRPGRLYDEREPSYQEISAAIRLGRKYQIAELYSQSVEFLQSYFPNIFLEQRQTAALLPPGWKELDAIGVVNLARLTGELSLLPSALVTCICAKSTGPNGIVHGNTQADGSEEHLSPNDLAICFNGKTSLRTATAAAAFRIFKPIDSRVCKRPAACNTAIREVLRSLEDNLGLLLDGDPFPSLRSLCGPRGSIAVCPDCMDMLQERSLREWSGVWDRLPELLGIHVPGWGAPPPPQAEVGAT